MTKFLPHLRPPQADDVITAYMTDDFVDTPVYQREKIMAGQRVTGPALIIEATGTNVIEPGWEAKMTPIGNLVVRRVDGVKAPRRDWHRL